jgi:uncharacterized protein
MDTPIQVDLGRIAQDLQIRRVQVESVVQLLDEGNTVPFITRYRKERTGNLNEVAIREIQLRVGRLRELAERKETILKAIEAQGKLTEDLSAAIRAADNSKRLEDLYLPFRPKKKTKASEAREKGLEPLALRIWNRDETLTDLTDAAPEFLNAEKEVDSVEKVLEGVRHILAEAISELASVRDAVRRVVWKTGKIVTSKAEIPEGEGLEYRDYFNYSEPIAHIPPHRVLAINRGDKEGPLKVKLEVSRSDLESAAFSQLPLEGHPHAEFFTASAVDALDRLLLPSMEREVRRDLTEMAERHAVDVFARNLRSLLLQPPILSQIVLAIDPGFRTGCKVAVLDGHGNLLEHGVIHPHAPQNRRSESKLFLKDLVGKHKVNVVAIGNGTACRETEELIAEIIHEGTTFSQNPAAAAEAEAAAQAHALHAAEKAAEQTAEAPAEAIPAPAAAEAPEPATECSPDPSAEPAPEAVSVPDEVIVQTVEHAEASSEPEPSPAPVPAPEPTGNDGHSEVSAEPPTADTPVEMFPPIVGGAPDEGEPAGPSTAAPEPSPMPLLTCETEAAPAVEEPSAEVPAEPQVLPDTPPAPIAEAEVAAAVAMAEAEPSVEESAPAPPPPAEAPTEVSAGESAEGEGDSDAVPTAVAPAAVSGAVPPAGTPPAAAAHAGKEKHHHAAPRPPRPKPTPAPPKPHADDALLAQLAYVIVNEAGASVYSASPIGREEFPDFDATLRSTISIGRRLQDPLAELVKIEPQSIGVGLYQHDVNPKQLKESLDAVISSCVNFVGVDLNTASVPLLRHVSGLNQLTARRLVEHRKETGPFKNRQELNAIDGIGPITFTQAAGFLKLRDGDHALDRTWVHPESYGVATRLLEKLGFAPDLIQDKEKLSELHAKLNEADAPALARELEVGELTLRDIFDALARPDRDPREDLPKPIFKKGVLKLEDLQSGMELKGTVLNVVDFGAFVDIGLKDSGLVHISQLANRYIKSPHDVVSVGDVVTVWVMGVDQERKRVSLTMVKPGTERPRGGQGGGRRGGGEGRTSGGGDRDRRGGGRPPRREGSALTSPPVGTGTGSAGGAAPSGEGRTADGGPPRSTERYAGGGRGPGQGQGTRAGAGGQAARGGQRQGGPGGASGRFERTQAPRPPAKPSKPAPPPPPLSKDALTGNVPLRTFGQLKQLWQARTEDSAPDEPHAEAAPEPPAEAPPAASEPTEPQGETPAPSDESTS